MMLSPPVRRAMLLASLLAIAPAALAFQPSRTQQHHPSIIASPPRDHHQSVAAVVGPNKIINNSHHVLTKSSNSRRMSSSTSTTLHLFGWNKDDEKEDTTSSSAIIEDKSNEEKDEEWYPNFLSKSFSFLKVALPSFAAGTIVTLGFLFLPLLSDYYDAFNPSSTNFMDSSNSLASNKQSNKGGSNINNVNQPVILFETILNDLNEAYVDDVDIQKLFETGVKAMTSSLDPYTEFESRLEARELEESVTGKYGGVGLVIRGGTNLKDLDDEVESGVEKIVETPVSSSSSNSPIKNNDKSPSLDASPPMAGTFGNSPGKVDKKTNTKVVNANDDNDDEDIELAERKRARKKSMEDGIRVVSAFEGYAYDAGFRVGDKLLAVDDFEIKPNTGVEEVRNHLRGDPGTPVSITFLREGVGGKVNEPQTITLNRAVVRIPDVKYFGFIGDPKDGIGYIDLSGFANDAGREVRFAIRALQHGAEMAAAGFSDDDPSSMLMTDPRYLKGLVLDLRSNPGGLLTSAVDVATLFVPNGSDIVSAKGRGFPETLYRSKTEPALNPSTRLAVLVNEQTASAAEIVTGAVQDLDVGVVVGKGRTFGKGLVQNVQDLPYQTALKYTVAKYYTPSGRCIQSTVYEEGSSDGENGIAKYKSKKVADKDRNVFYTANGRQVKDGGGVEVDYKVEPQKASPLEIILLNSGAYSDYAAEWSKNHELTDNFKVDDATYKDFQRFVEKRQQDGDMKLEVLYDSQLKELQKKLKASKFDSSRRELDKLRADIIKDVKKDFSTYKPEIIEDIEQNILARYLPDSMLIERGLKKDQQVSETAKMLKDGREFDRILARDNNSLEQKSGVLTDNANQRTTSGYETSSTAKPVPTLQSRW